MNAAVSMQSCLSEEVLAAFIDQRLDPKSRLEVVQHLADCGECRDIVVAANEYSAEDAAQTRGTVVRGQFRSSSRWIAPLAAAAAVILVLFGVPASRERILGGNPMEDLVEAANGLPERATAARLSGAFAHKRHSTPRGGDDKMDEHRASLNIQTAAWTAIERAQKRQTAANLHASGVGRLLLKEQRDEAVNDLEKAARANSSSAAIFNDLAAAYIARGRTGDYERAHTAATKAWNLEQSPAAAWNMALALQYAGHDTAAIAAWQKYLTIDRDSSWAIEAKDKLAGLQELQRLRQPKQP